MLKHLAGNLLAQQIKPLFQGFPCSPAAGRLLGHRLGRTIAPCAPQPVTAKDGDHQSLHPRRHGVDLTISHTWVAKVMQIQRRTAGAMACPDADTQAGARPMTSGPATCGLYNQEKQTGSSRFLCPRPIFRLHCSCCASLLPSSSAPRLSRRGAIKLPVPPFPSAQPSRMLSKTPL